MIGVSKLLFDAPEPGARFRYAPDAHRRPVVVWNVTPACNLACRHCYAAVSGRREHVLDTGESKAVLDDLAAFDVPVLLFSGGEPFARPDIRQLAEYAKEKGLRVTFSTNGTLIDDSAADWLRDLGVSYVGVSIDGTEEEHDDFRRSAGAYRKSIDAIRRLRARGVKVGLRVTLTRANAASVPALFALMRSEDIPRICLYHLVYTGRGRDIAADDLTRAEARNVFRTIVSETRNAFADGFCPEVLTVDNHADGAALVMQLRDEGDPAAEKVYERLARNGGNSSGLGIGCISWDGTVFPDQFWRNHPLGNVRERPFSEIWSNPPPGSLLDQLRNRRGLLRGRCRSCRWLDICGGNFRARGEAVTGDPWGEDPACYLTDAETRPAADGTAGGAR